MHPLIESHRTELRSLARRYGVRSIRVFGSMARDDASQTSDVDLLVEASGPLSGFSLGALLMDAQDLLGRRVDVVTLNSLHPLMRDRVLRESLPV
ncbi:MAG: nucleotidyltransferase family protein [Rhodoferax sp.]|nr:nucleotidyltransferase family protein [Rhodoferax sp.]